MGTIISEVRQKHLINHPNEEDFLKPFLSGFDITYGKEIIEFSSHLSVYILKPEDFIKEAFGINNEIMLVYAPYDSMEPRTIQAADSFLQDFPFKSRVDILSYFLVSDDIRVNDWLNNYYLDRQESRIIIPFSKKELIDNKGDGWFVRNRLSQNYLNRDLFGYTLPLTEDTYYFGRQQILANYIDSIRRSENRGIFGLRKTGKTSLLFKIQRTSNAENLGQFFFYDCKSPSLRKLRWNELLGEICNDISNNIHVDIKQDYGEINIIKTFRSVLKDAERRKVKIILIFDEIEYISFKSLTDTHWQRDFIDFWQTMWSAQSVFKNLTYIISGVNPSVVEIDKVNGIQNPLFGIVQYEYLKGFSEEELKSMLKALGKRMGLTFDHSAIKHLFEWYGGHPMLTRLACSWINKDYQSRKTKRPIIITKDVLIESQLTRDSDLGFYCKHVVSELQDFYPEEYEMLEYLASGQLSLFIELSAYNEFVKHLKSYGLVGFDQFGNPKILLPVIGRYIGVELAKKEGRQSIFKVIDSKDRVKWLEQRKSAILRDLRMLEKIIQLNSLPSLFGHNSFPEADEFKEIKVVKSKNEFVAFINTCNRCFVESIDIHGKAIKDTNYFWGLIKSAYEGLHHSLHRIKVYRHEQDHLLLQKGVNDKLLEFLDNDLEGQKSSSVKELYFVLEQRVLDGLLSGIHIEINKYN